MKCLGLLGGLSPESSALYARLIHGEVRQHRGSAHSARLIASGLNRHELHQHCMEGRWSCLGELLSVEAVRLAAAGADGLLLDSSVLHVAAAQLQGCGTSSFFHLADELIVELAKGGARCVGLLGTRFRPEEAVWIDRLRRINIDVVMPSLDDREHLVKIIETELVHGYGEESARVDFLRIMKALKRQRAETMILVAPELALLADGHHSHFSIVDAARLQVGAAVRWALGLSGPDLTALAHETPS